MSAPGTAGPFDLTGRVALVTGSTRGIGRGLASALAGGGASVVLHGRAAQSVDVAREALDGELRARGAVPRLHGVAFDVRDRTAMRAGVAEVEKLVGPVDVLVNNAGMQYRSPAVEFPAQAWRDVLDTNLTAAFDLAQAVAPGMIARGRGKIINICSVQNERARGTTVAYAAAKAGLGALGRALCDDWARFGIQVNGLAPGYIATELNADLIADDAGRRYFLERIPAARFGTPDDLGGTVVWLASRASDYVNGQVVYVDGGMTAVV